jgi:hypothetical protein
MLRFNIHWIDSGFRFPGIGKALHLAFIFLGSSRLFGQNKSHNSLYAINPDGLVKNKLNLNEPGVLISEININKKYYNTSRSYRENAIKGKLNSGEIIRNERSENRKIHW